MSRKLPQSDLLRLASTAFQISLDETKVIFPSAFPLKDKVSIHLVKDVTWPAYQWYLGNYQSRIEINQDASFTLDMMLPLICHEVYPGHHFERIFKEKYLVEKGFLEHCFASVLSPAAIISEGLGKVAENILFSREELFNIELGGFHLDMPMSINKKSIPFSLLELIVKRRALHRKSSSSLMMNVVLFACEYGWKRKKLIKYVQQFDIMPVSSIKDFITQVTQHPVWRLHVFTYDIGEAMIRKKITSNHAQNDFLQLLKQPLLPSELL